MLTSIATCVDGLKRCATRKWWSLRTVEIFCPRRCLTRLVRGKCVKRIIVQSGSGWSNKCKSWRKRARRKQGKRNILGPTIQSLADSQKRTCNVDKEEKKINLVDNRRLWKPDRFSGLEVTGSFMYSVLPELESGNSTMKTNLLIRSIAVGLDWRPCPTVVHVNKTLANFFPIHFWSYFQIFGRQNVYGSNFAQFFWVISRLTFCPLCWWIRKNNKLFCFLEEAGATSVQKRWRKVCVTMSHYLTTLIAHETQASWLSCGVFLNVFWSSCQGCNLKLNFKFHGEVWSSIAWQ